MKGGNRGYLVLVLNCGSSTLITDAFNVLGGQKIVKFVQLELLALVPMMAFRE
jgi:hypothetical protein